MTDDSVGAEICAALSEVARCCLAEGSADYAWTRRVKQAICEVGRGRGFKVAATGCAGADVGEWMFDIAWYVSDGGWWTTRSVALAAESEWGLSFDAIAWDFEKLLVAKSPWKLLVYQQIDGRKLSETMEHLRRMIARFEQKSFDERYLLAGYVINEKRFHFSLVNSEGHVGRVIGFD